MALTKARPPVTEISEMANGTTDVTISSAGGPIDIDVAGSDFMDIGPTNILVDPAVELEADDIMTEDIAIQTTSGAEGVVRTEAAKMEIGTTNSNPVELLMNDTPSLTLETDGKVTLGTQGTDPTDLVDKSYVDAQAAVELVTTLAATGQVALPNSTGDDLIIKWGSESGTGNRTVTFGTAFPNAIFVVFCQPQGTVAAASDGWWRVHTVSTTGFTFNAAAAPGASFTDDIYWLAIGY
jgi:hypothetical protein